MEKIDLKKEYASLYKASAKKTDIVKVPEMSYIMCDGHGDPNNSKLFEDAIAALYSVAYTVKFMIKKGKQQIDYGVMPLEGLWWADDMNDFMQQNKAAWKWTLMIMQPKFVTKEIFNEAKQLAGKKKELAMLEQLRLETIDEGLVAQTLYIGPYNQETDTIKKLHDFIKANGYELRGKHREIYLNDMRRTAPEKLKTIIRQPIGK